MDYMDGLSFIMHDSSNHMEFYKNVPVGVKLSKI